MNLDKRDDSEATLSLLLGANRSLLGSLIAPSTVNSKDDGNVNSSTANEQYRREAQIRVFVKQLLTALQYMHHRNIAHLDLRPEAILLQDDHLILADFGQSRHLLRGKATGAIKSTPEFVSPEIVAGTTITLSSDMWSAGVLTYVLLAGLSPFLGDNDNETFSNVISGRYDLNIPEMAYISPEAKDFLARLILLDPYKRMSIDEALNHDWISDPALRDAKLSTDCLREFKYRGNWLERRVFVQQTPSEELTKYIETPVSKIESINESVAPTNAVPSAEPRAMYDYLKIKNEIKETESAAPPIPAKTLKQSQVQLTPAQQQQILAQFPQWLLAQLPVGVRPEQLLAWTTNPRQLAAALQLVPPSSGASPFGWDSSLNQPNRCSSAERHRLQPQLKGETPSNKVQTVSTSASNASQSLPKLPLHLIRGERRAIEEEIANRILSDISEENSIAESLLSADDLGEIQRMRFEDLARWRQQRKTESHSPSITPQHDASSETTTPLALSPALTAESNGGAFFSDQESKNPYVGETLLDDALSNLEIPSSLPGIKSAVQLSPGQERAMNVTIASNKDKEVTLDPILVNITSSMQTGARQMIPLYNEKLLSYDTSSCLRPKRFTTDNENKKQKYRPLPDTEYDLLMSEVDRIKQGIKNEKAMMDELEKYRPKNIYKENDGGNSQPDMDLDSYKWESDYQIGPDTLLLATRGPAFNARVRDYRRELWGDGAPYVHFGILGKRNADITVRERRRFTDLIREDPLIEKSVFALKNNVNGVAGKKPVVQQKVNQFIKTQTVHGNDSKTHTDENSIQSEVSGEKYFPTFRSRLRDVCFREDFTKITLTCKVVGNPPPEVTFFHYESALCDGGRYKISQKDNTWSLSISNPLQTDSGEYSCVISNNLGTDRCACSALYGEGIGKPSRPDIELSSDTEVLLRWDPPEQLPTTMEGVVYRVECRLAGENDNFAKWNVISNCVESECAVVKHLAPLGIYQFRITARNGFGWSVPGITSRIIQTHPRGTQKLNLNVLRQEVKLAVITMPQRTSRQGNGLSEIIEELEGESIKDEDGYADDDPASVGSAAAGSDAGSEQSIGSQASLLTREERLTLNTSEDHLKRFQLESELFRGEYSVIRYAVEIKNGRHCVAKIRSASRLEGNKDDDLLREHKMLAAVQHENVVKLLAAYSCNNFLLLFTERLHENIFDRFVYPDSFTEEQVAFTVRQLASALHWIHYKGIVHLDVEPSNVMFASKRSWLLKLIDFENAQIIGTKRTKRPNKRPAEWSAPEIINSHSKSRAYESNLRLFDAMIMSKDSLPDKPLKSFVNGLAAHSTAPKTQSKTIDTAENTWNPETDMWGLGLITFCLLGGFHPFSSDEDSEAEVAENVLCTKCDPNLIPVQASEEALRFVTWALKKEPRRRMTTGEALSHRFLACNPAMLRRRENIRYPSTRLRRTYDRMLRQRALVSQNIKNKNSEGSNGSSRFNQLNRSLSGSLIPSFQRISQ